MSQSVQYTDQFQALEVTNLYRLGVMGPRWDRARRHTGASAIYRIILFEAGHHSEISAQLESGVLIVAGTMLDDPQLVRFSAYQQGLFGGTRLMFECPACQRRCSVLYVPNPWSLIKPNGNLNQQQLLCKHCHGLRTPSWRYHGGNPGRVLHQRRRLTEKLGEKPAERPKGCSVTRHNRRFTRWLSTEHQVLRTTHESA